MHLFTIFGNPVHHSKSPLMHNKVFYDYGIDACYTRTLLEDGSKLKEVFLRLGLKGANVTVPHKEAAFAACDEVRGFAKRAGVVNTLVYHDKKLIGYNTDADGFLFAMKKFQNVKKVLVIGAGGTAKALVMRFLEENLEVSVLNRSAKRLKFFESIGALTFTWDHFRIDSYDLVLNTTSAGLEEDSLPAPQAMLETIFDHTRYVADAIYGKLTPFLALAQTKKLPFIDGTDMLIAQGVLANELFGIHTLSKEQILTSMRQSLTL